MIQMYALYLDFEGAKNLHVIKVLIWGIGECWRFLIDLDMAIGLWYTHVQTLPFFFNFEGAKNIHVLHVLIWGFGGCWRSLTGVGHFDLALDMVTGH